MEAERDQSGDFRAVTRAFIHWPLKSTGQYDPNSNPQYIILTNQESMPAPALSDVAAWQDIIVRRAFNEYRPEELITVYDTRSPDSDSTVVEEIQAYIIWSIERVLDYFLGHGDLNNNVSERKHLARSSVYDALLDPTSQDGLSLRRYFRRTIHNRCVDALRKQFQYRRRFSVLESSDIDLGDDHLDDDPDGPYEGPSVRTEDRLNLEIDLKNMWLAIAHAGRRLTLEMLIKGYTQEEIALAAGVSDRQVRRWLKSLKDEASKKPDME